MVMLLSIGLLSSCTFFERAECETNADCTSAFGEGSICTLNETETTGFCSLCETNDDCIDAYGNGAICAAREGVTSEFEFVEDAEPKYCEVELNPITRCDTSFPDNIWDDWETYSDAIIIGQMFRGEADLSKTVATQIAIEQIQEAQDEDEKPIVSVLCDYSTTDDGLDEDGAVELITDHLADEFGVNVIIGPSSSDATQTAIDHLDGRAVVISPSATSDTLTEEQLEVDEENPAMFWRTVAADIYQTTALTELIIAEGGENVGIIYTDSDYSRNIVEKIQTDLPEEIATQAGLISDGTDFTDFLDGTDTDFTDVTSIVTISSNVEELQGMLTAILEYQSVTSDTRNYFFTDAAVRDTVFTEDIRDLISADNTDVINRIWGTRPSILEDGTDFIFFNELFEPAFKEASGNSGDNGAYKFDAENNIYASHSYDAMWVGAFGVLWAEYNGGQSPNNISTGLSNLTGDLAPGQRELSLTEENWKDIAAEFEETEAVNIVGASGDLNFSEMTGQVSSRIEIWKIDQDSNQQIETECMINPSGGGRGGGREERGTGFQVDCEPYTGIGDEPPEEE